MRILVTGAAGLIGSAIAARLAQDYDVIGLDLRPGDQVGIIADCFNLAEWRHQTGKIDAVVHTAALHAPHVGSRSDEEFHRTNVDATSRLIDFAVDSGATRFVLTSTTSIYGHALSADGTAVWVDEWLEPQPRDIYDETKLAAERLAESAGDAMTVTSLRMSRCFPEPSHVMAWYRLYRGIDRRDVAEAHALALARSGPPAAYIISGATPFLREDCEQLAADPVAAIEARYPGLVAELAGKGWHPPQSIERVYDSGLAAAELGFRPRYGIRSCLAGDWDPHPSR